MPASRAKPKSARGTLAAVRRAVAGTLNREVDVHAERQSDGRWHVQLLDAGRASPPIRMEAWEIQAMREVPLIPAHKRGIFLRHYAILQGRP